MCMPRYFGAKLVDGKKEDKKNKKCTKSKKEVKTIHQSKVDFE